MPTHSSPHVSFRLAIFRRLQKQLNRSECWILRKGKICLQTPMVNTHTQLNSSIPVSTRTTLTGKSMFFGGKSLLKKLLTYEWLSKVPSPWSSHFKGWRDQYSLCVGDTNPIRFHQKVYERWKTRDHFGEFSYKWTTRSLAIFSSESLGDHRVRWSHSPPWCSETLWRAKCLTCYSFDRASISCHVCGIKELKSTHTGGGPK